MSNKKSIARISAQILLLALILLYSKNIWCHNKIIVFSDIDFGLYDATYIERIFGVFNSYFSSMNFFNLSRLFLIVPLYLISLVGSKYIIGVLLKSLILTVFLLSGFGMYRLCEKILLKHFTQKSSGFHYTGIVIPSIFYAINPWVLMRVQHIFLLAGYACFPWVLYFFFDIFDIDLEESWIGCEDNLTQHKIKGKIHPIIYRDIKSSFCIAFFVAIGSAAIHYFFFIILALLFLSVIISIYVMRKSKQVMKIFKIFIRKSLILYSAIFSLCAYWIIPYFIALLSANIEPNNVNVVDTLGMFSRNSDLINVSYLISYWWPMFNKDIFLDTGFWIGGGIFLFLILAIAFYRFKWHFYIRVFTITTAVLLLFSSGLNFIGVDQVYITVVTKLPIIGHIFRDPNKILGPLVLFMCILISFAIDRYLFVIKKEGFGKIVTIVFIMALFLAHYSYIKPFDLVFSKYFYSGSTVPKEYADVSNHLDLTKGKILWLPSMDNMVLSNGVSNYSWNVPEDENLRKLNLRRLSGDFHLYSSLKPAIFQHENNDGMVSYVYSFIQYSLDRTGGQHLGTFINWLGFDEVGVHNDVMKQEQRQAFNNEVMKRQKDLTLKHQDKIFDIYSVPNGADQYRGTSKSLLLTKGLYPFLYSMDYMKELKVSPSDTAVLWSQGKKSQYKLTDNDLVVGDNRWDIYLPFVDDKYFIYPFNNVNTGDPNVGWAKTLTKEGEWLWIMKTNQIKNFDFENDYSQGVVYTYVSHRLNIPSYKLKQQNKQTLLSIKDIMDNFFTPDNQDTFKLNIFPEVSSGRDVLQGVLQKGNPGTNMWQVAKSKYIDISALSGGYIDLEAVVSGVNAGSVNFKIRFFDDNIEELGVAYLSNPDNTTEFSKTRMNSVVYVPPKAKKMRIDILCTQDTVRNTYFWIHDFEINNISSMVEINDLRVPIRTESKNDKYHIFMRSYFSPNGAKMNVSVDQTVKEVTLENNFSKFKWQNLGVVYSKDKEIRIVPSDGLNVVNTFVVIPEEEYEAEMKRVENMVKGKQADFSLTFNDWDLKTELQIDDLSNEFVFPNTINGDYTLLNGGKLSKMIDIIKDDEYRFDLTGYIPENSKPIITVYKDGKIVEQSKVIRSQKQPDRNFRNQHFRTVQKDNKYFLSIGNNIDEKWDVSSYTSDYFGLLKGQYKIEITLEQTAKNGLNINSLHYVEPKEVVVPDELIDKDAALLSILVPNVATSIKKQFGNTVLKNEKSSSKLWIIGGFNKSFVKKGQKIVFEATIKASGVNEIHGKLLWVDKDKKLLSNDYVPYNIKNNKLYIMSEAKSDGYVLPCIFYQSDSKEDGLLQVDNANFIILDDVSKVEGVALLPINSKTSESIKPTLAQEKGIVKGTEIGYLIQNEAFNVYWEFYTQNKVPTQLTNFIHNGYYMNFEPFEGTFKIKRVLDWGYKISLIFSMLMLVYMLRFIIIFNKRTK